MSNISIENQSYQAALKKLKAARKEQIVATTRRMQVQRQAVKAIKGQLAAAELTVPEIAEATGLPAAEVLWYVASLKKYGEILEGAKAGSYYRYKLGQPLAEDTAPAADE
jgi:hypothetical protein